MLRACIAVLLAAAILAPRAAAWNATGHRIAAAIAYDRLTPQARARVDLLILRHPDYATMLSAGTPPDPAGRARAAFIAASYWPDLIRSDPRFYDDTRPGVRPTRLLPGFPDMGRHTNWHYYDLPFTQDGTRLKKQPPPHALSELERLIRAIERPVSDAASPAYALPWLVHLAGDVHNPLHCTSRFSSQHPDGDQGGNLVYVTGGRTLHSVWDEGAGTDTAEPYVNRMAAEIAREYAAKAAETNPRKWIEEGFQIARARVYTFGAGSGTVQQPVVLPGTYHAAVQQTARQQLAAAGIRLAAVLNRELAR